VVSIQYARGAGADEIDYKIFGSEMQYVEVTLDPGETVIAEAGAMMYMTPGIRMETVFGDPSRAAAGLPRQDRDGGQARAHRRVAVRHDLHRAAADARSSPSLALPRQDHPAAPRQHGGEIICQKDSFICAARGVQIGIAFQKKIGVGLFGGEGFIMQRLTGDGIALVHAGGTIMERVLKPGETIRLDTGCLVALEKSVQYDIQMVGGFQKRDLRRRRICSWRPSPAPEKSGSSRFPSRAWRDACSRTRLWIGRTEMRLHPRKLGGCRGGIDRRPSGTVAPEVRCRVAVNYAECLHHASQL
jgi:uncharacterized protein (AIM24 family)